MRPITIAAFAVLLVSIMIIGSVHTTLASSRNIQEIQQNCGNSCSGMTSSNTITSGSSGSTTASPSTSPSSTPTTLTLAVIPLEEDALYIIDGTLTTDTGSPIAGATITFTVTDGAGHQIPITIPSQVTNGIGRYDFQFVNQLAGDSVTAHYAGTAPSAGNAASNSPSTVVS